VPSETVQLRKTATFAYLIAGDGPNAGVIFQLRQGSLVLGRSGSADVRLDDPAISAEQARIRWEDEAALTLIDLGSENGTKVNGRRTQQHVLRHNDLIEVGETRLVFKLVQRGS